MRTGELELEDEVAALIEHEKPLGKAAYETLVMDLFRRRKVSTGRACELLGHDRAAFARRANDLDIPYFQITEEEWAAEKASIVAWPRSS
jgi:hypothetical protein